MFKGSRWISQWKNSVGVCDQRHTQQLHQNIGPLLDSIDTKYGTFELELNKQKLVNLIEIEMN